MAQQGRNERCRCGSGRKVKRCCGVRRGPSEAVLAKAFLHQQAQAAALVLAARSDAEVVALLEAATRLPRQEVAMQLPLPRLLGSALERLRWLATPALRRGVASADDSPAGGCSHNQILASSSPQIRSSWRTWLKVKARSEVPTVEAAVTR